MLLWRSEQASVRRQHSAWPREREDAVPPASPRSHRPPPTAAPSASPTSRSPPPAPPRTTSILASCSRHLSRRYDDELNFVRDPGGDPSGEAVVLLERCDAFALPLSVRWSLRAT